MTAVSRPTLRVLVAAWQHLSGRPLFRGLNMLMVHLGLRGLGYLNYQSRAVTGEEYFVRHILPRWLPEEPVVLDVGAHAGEYAELVIRSFPTARLHALEPHPASFRRLAERAQGRFMTHNIGLSDAAGRVPLHDYAAENGSSHASLHREVFERVHRRESAQHLVDVTTLDDFLESHGIERVSLLKIDTEGHECRVLRGARRLIDAGAIDLIQFEFSELSLACGCLFNDIAHLLPGFEFHMMLPHGLIPLDRSRPAGKEIFAFHNIVARRGPLPADRKSA